MRKLFIVLMLAVSFAIGMVSQYFIAGQANAANDDPQVVSIRYTKVYESAVPWKGYLTVELDSKIARCGETKDESNKAFIYVSK